MNKSKIFFVITVILVTIGIVIMAYGINYYNTTYKEGYDEFLMVRQDYEAGYITREKFDSVKNKHNSQIDTRNALRYSPYVIWGIAAVTLTTGIVFKVKERNK